MWYLWRERNRGIFEGQEIKVERLKSFAEVLFYWMYGSRHSNVCDFIGALGT